MKIVRYLNQNTSKFFFLFIILGLFSGGLNSALLVFINSGLSDLSVTDGEFVLNYQSLGTYAVILVLFILAQRTFQRYLINLTEKLIFRVRIEILDMIRKCSLASFERIGEETIYSVLTRDSITISTASTGIVYAFTSLVTVVFCFGYLAFLSWKGFLVVVVVALLATVMYIVRQRKIQQGFEKARELENGFFKYMNHMLSGIKEMKLDRKKNDDLFENYITDISAKTKSHNISSTLKFLDNSLTGNIAFMLLVGSLVFVFPVFADESTATIVSFVIITLYLIGPMEGLMQVVPVITRASISIDRLEDLKAQIETEVDIEPSAVAVDTKVSFDAISFNNLVFEYQGKDDEKSFGIGPINFDVKRSDLVFIVGGNGSGKTTLFKLISGLYTANTGEIEVDGVPLSSFGRERFKSMIAAVFSDFFLFDKTYGLEEGQEKVFEKYAKQMQIEEKVSLSGKDVSTLNLSTGQRKRVALIMALLEDKPILLLDEWAADQDPIFRKFFYEEFIPQLQASGKTIIAISHDDRYFHHCDKLMKMEYGKMKEIKNLKGDTINV
jgi:putative ATP-binding cassette transporter